jgi:hypothetical protein
MLTVAVAGRRQAMAMVAIVMVIEGPDSKPKLERLSIVNPSASAGSERSTARQIQSKLTEFVCPSSTRPHPLARNGARRPDRFNQN